MSTREEIARIEDIIGKHLGPHLAISPTPRHEAIVRECARIILSARDERLLKLVEEVAQLAEDYTQIASRSADPYLDGSALAYADCAARLRDVIG